MSVSQPKKDGLAGKTDSADKNRDSVARHAKQRRGAGQIDAIKLQDPALLTAALTSAINVMRDAVILYDMQGRPLYANAMTIEAYGYDPAKSTRAQGLKRLQISDQAGKPVSLEALPSTRALKGETVRDEVYRFIDVQGVERWINVSALPVHLDGGQVGAVSIWRDVTEREMLLAEQVRASQAIETERDLLRTLLDSIDDEVWFCDPQGNITLVNDRAAKGLGLEGLDRDAKHHLQTEVLDRLVTYNTDGSTRSDADAPLYRALRGEHWRGGEIVRNPRTNQVMHRHANASPIRSKDGEIIGAVAVVRDISDIQQAQQALIDREAQLRASEAELRLSEAELRLSEVRFRGTFENAAVGMAHISMDGRFLRVNPRLCQITGYAREVLEAKTFQEITYPEDLQADLDLVAQMRAGEIDHYTLEKRYFRQDGSIVWVNLTVGIQRNDAGQPDYFIISVEDISDRKAAECALQETSTRLEYFVNSNMVGIVIGDAEGRISEANDYYLNLIGYTRADMESRQLRWVDLTPLEHLSTDRRALAELARRGACEPYEKEYIRKDGSRVWVLMGHTLLPDGQIMAFVLDDSARKQAEGGLLSALYRAEEGQRTLEALMQYVPEGIAITGGPPNFNIRLVSRYGSEMTGRPDIEILHMPAGEHAAFWRVFNSDGVTLAGPDDLPLYRASHFGEEIIGRELVVESSDGRKIPILVNAAPVRDDAGRIIAAINCWRDITDRKEMEDAFQHYADELKQSNQDLENFAFVASHDLQEPLRKITSFGDILKDRLTGQIDAATEDLLERMISAGDRMKTMINDLLELSRINTRGQAFVPVDLNAIATEVLSDLEPAIERVRDQVLLEPLPQIEADPLQMRQLIQNLISNALKFHKPGELPVVRVSSARKDGMGPQKVTLTIADNGIGFDLEYFDRILQPFQRLHGRGEYEGTGIGLAICKRIVDRHGGQIRAESVPGQGSTFIITLPVEQ